MFGNENGQQRRGCRDAQSDAAEMQRLQVATAGRGKMAEDDRRHEHHDEGAGEPGKQADDEECRYRLVQTHQSRKHGAGGKADQHPQG